MTIITNLSSTESEPNSSIKQSVCCFKLRGSNFSSCLDTFRVLFNHDFLSRNAIEGDVSLITHLFVDQVEESPGDCSSSSFDRSYLLRTTYSSRFRHFSQIWLVLLLKLVKRTDGMSNFVPVGHLWSGFNELFLQFAQTSVNHMPKLRRWAWELS